MSGFLKKFIEENHGRILFITSNSGEAALKEINKWLEDRNWDFNNYSYTCSSNPDTIYLRSAFYYANFVINLTDSWAKDIILREMEYSLYED